MGELVTQSFTPQEIIRNPKLIRNEPAMFASGFVIARGAVMGFAISGTYAGLYIPYLSTATDGSEFPAGLSPYAVDTSSTGQNRNVDMPLHVGGDFYYSALQALNPPGAAGNLDAGAIAALGGRVIPGTDTFSFNI